MRSAAASTLVINQSNYIPWRGYFDLIRQANMFLILDNVQYTKNDWRNRNLVKTPSGPLWLTIPVVRAFPQPIDQVRIAAKDWAAKHIRAVELNYQRAQGYEDVSPWLFDCLRTAGEMELLSASNEYLLKAICGRLGISTPVRRATDIVDRAELDRLDRNERLVRLCEAVGAGRYLSGPAAKSYIDDDLFRARGIELSFMSYEGYPDYPQCWKGFEPRVSIVDLLLNCGDRAASYLDRIP